MTKLRGILIVQGIGLLIIIGLPVLGTWLRRQSNAGCALDGIHIDPIFEVRIIDAENMERRFCCLECARWWQSLQKREPKRVLVTDEVSGRLLDAEAANFVRSGVITNPTTGNRVHVFQNRFDAQRHAETSRGTILENSLRPFAIPTYPTPPN